MREVQEKAQGVGLIETETLNRVRCGEWDMKESKIMDKLKTFKGFSRVFVGVVVDVSEIKTSLKHIFARLTDLEDRVTENGG